MLRQDWSIVEQHELLCLVTLQSRSDLDLRYAFDTCSSDMLTMFAECEFARGLTVPRLFNPDGIKALLCTVEIVRNPGDSCSSIKYRLSETAYTIESFDAVWKSASLTSCVLNGSRTKLESTACHTGDSVTASILMRHGGFCR